MKPAASPGIVICSEMRFSSFCPLASRLASLIRPDVIAGSTELKFASRSSLILTMLTKEQSTNQNSKQSDTSVGKSHLRKTTDYRQGLGPVA